MPVVSGDHKQKWHGDEFGDSQKTEKHYQYRNIANETHMHFVTLFYY